MKQLLIISLTAICFGCHSNSSHEKSAAENPEIMEIEEREKNKESVRQFFTHLEEENIERFVEMFAKDGEQINPYASGIFPEGAKGHDELLAYWNPVPENFDGMEFIIDELLGTEDSKTVFVRYTGKIKLKEDAGFYENQYYSTFKFNDEGKITEYVEIFNPIVAAKAFGLTDSIQ